MVEHGSGARDPFWKIFDLSDSTALRVDVLMNDDNRPDPKTPEELKAMLIEEAIADLDDPENAKQPSVLDSALAMRLWDDFLRR